MFGELEREVSRLGDRDAVAQRLDGSLDELGRHARFERIEHRRTAIALHAVNFCVRRQRLDRNGCAQHSVQSTTAQSCERASGS